MVIENLDISGHFIAVIFRSGENMEMNEILLCSTLKYFVCVRSCSKLILKIHIQLSKITGEVMDRVQDFSGYLTIDLMFLEKF